jgi:putative transposase
MNYEPENIYHLYNQGNNKQKIFYSDENYIFFIRKIRKYLLPHTDILAYCLMPNHFHILARIKPESCQKVLTKDKSKFNNCNQIISHQIGIMLSSYTKAINKQEQRTGSLFRKRTKSKNCFVEAFRTQSSINDYLQMCFNYIHQNPVKAQLVSKSTDWVYSSALDYAGLRKGTLCNKALAKQLRLL